MKRLLSLALAAVFSAGILAVPATAASYGDGITYPRNYSSYMVNGAYKDWLKKKDTATTGDLKSLDGMGEENIGFMSTSFSDNNDIMIKYGVEALQQNATKLQDEMNNIARSIIPYEYDQAQLANSVDYNGDALSSFILTAETHYRKYQNWIDTQPIVDKIAADIMKSGKSDRERVTLLNEYIGKTVEYDMTLGANREYWDWTNQECWGALRDGSAVCAGYSNAFFRVCEAMNIPVVCAYGWLDKKSDSNLHKWNEVFIDNQWLVVDTTSNDPVVNGKPMSDDAKYRAFGKKYLLKTKAEAQALGLIYKNEGLRDAKDLAYPNIVDDLADVLKSKGLFTGDATGYRLTDSLTRAEMAAMLARVAGGTADIKNDKAMYEKMCTFTDVPDWAKAYVGWGVSKGYIKGIGDNLYGASNIANKKDYCTVMLRAIGLTEDTAGYTYDTSMDKASDVDILSGIRWLTPELNRADVVSITYKIMEQGKIK